MPEKTHLLVMRGDTRPAKESLKSVGWRWNPERQYWWMRIVSAHAEIVRAELAKGGHAKFAFDSLKINRKGCQVTLDGAVIWTSKTFGETPASPATTRNSGSRRADIDIYDLDAYGNTVSARKIPGSEDYI